MQKVLRVQQQVGGTHHRTVVLNGVWYQTFGSSLLVVDSKTAGVLHEVKFGKPGEIGPAIDLVVRGDRAFVIIEDDSVIELSLVDPKFPEVVRTLTAALLGIQPRTLSEVDGELFVSGRGGVVRLGDLKQVFSTPEIAGRVAEGEGGLMVCVGRRVLRMSDGEFVGSATDLAAIPSGFNRDSGDLLFVRQNESGALAGLMSAAIREVDAKTGTIGVPGIARAVRLMNNRVYIAHDSAVSVYRIDGSSMVAEAPLNVIGARDLAQLDENHLAVAGSFGRAIYRINDQSIDAASPFVAVKREAGRLETAVTDGRHVLAASAEGVWMYLISSRATLVTQPMRSAPPPPQQASTVDGKAQIVEDGAAVVITRAGHPQLRHVEPGPATIRCVAAIDGNFWVGHDRGITVIYGQQPVLADSKKKSLKEPPTIDPVAGRVRVPGPVIYLHPLLVGGGASYVSQFGGFGVVTFGDEPVPATVNPSR